jgi:hypothetical protein
MPTKTMKDTAKKQTAGAAAQTDEELMMTKEGLKGTL